VDSGKGATLPGRRGERAVLEGWRRLPWSRLRPRPDRRAVKCFPETWCPPARPATVYKSSIHRGALADQADSMLGAPSVSNDRIAKAHRAPLVHRPFWLPLSVDGCRSRCPSSGGAFDFFNPDVPSANAVTRSRILAQMIPRKHAQSFGRNRSSRPAFLKVAGLAVRYAGTYQTLGDRCVEEAMKQSDIYRQNAENCAYLAESAGRRADTPAVQTHGSGLEIISRRTGLA